MRHVIDATGPTNWNKDKEGRALRKKVLGWTYSRIQGRVAKDHDYAKALGIELFEARRKIEAQRKIPQTIEIPRRFTDARGPTNWGKDSEAKKLRRKIRASIDARVRSGKE